MFVLRKVWLKLSSENNHETAGKVLPLEGGQEINHSQRFFLRPFPQLRKTKVRMRQTPGPAFSVRTPRSPRNGEILKQVGIRSILDSALHAWSERQIFLGLRRLDLSLRPES